jgi:predicted lipid-binding transport protein (Tim44 family)
MIACVLALLIIAAAGGGSAHFGGGGGGGGSGARGTHGGGVGGVAGILLLLLTLTACVALVVGIVWFEHRRRRKRVAHVEAAAAEAGEDDAAFAPAHVVEQGTALFHAVQEAWTRRDRARLAELVAPSLLTEWIRRLDDFERKGWHNVVDVKKLNEVSYMGLVNRAGHDEDRVVLGIRAWCEDYVVDGAGATFNHSGSNGRGRMLDEYWTLSKRDGRWILESIEGGEEGKHHLKAPVVATPWGDDERLRQDAVAELATADAAPDGFAPAELAGDGAGALAVADLALADGRFDAGLIDATVRRIVDAWEAAVDGDDAALEALAHPGAVRALLHPGEPTRSVIRGAEVLALRIGQLDAAAAPPAVTVDVELRARRYVEDRDTAALLSGNRDAPATWTEAWRLALDGPPDWPWRLSGRA